MPTNPLAEILEDIIREWDSIGSSDRTTPDWRVLSSALAY